MYHDRRRCHQLLEGVPGLVEAARAIEAGLRRVCPKLEAGSPRWLTAARAPPLPSAPQRSAPPAPSPARWGSPVRAELASDGQPALQFWRWPLPPVCPWSPLTAGTLCIPPPAVWENSLPMHWNGAAGTSWSASAARPPTMAVQACLPPWASGCWTRTDSPFPMVLPGWKLSASTPPGCVRSCGTAGSASPAMWKTPSAAPLAPVPSTAPRKAPAQR